MMDSCHFCFYHADNSLVAIRWETYWKTALDFLCGLRGGLFKRAGKDVPVMSDLHCADEATFASLLATHESLIRRICFFYASCEEELQDMRQDTLVNIWKGIERFRGEALASTWIYRVCVNTCVTYIRNNRNRRNDVSLDLALQIAEEGDSNENVANLMQLIYSLGKIDRALMMMWLDGYGYEEIAEMCGMNRNTVATRLRRAKERMRAEAGKADFGIKK